ncbi:MAG: PadR family transcriptional regulator [Thermococcus sp.]|uniref:PadR family transcriptional regulator n=1 Tax=Thermococcus guaymasensis DSM 11113 TaxID=1432656 RepID=A0A0X1KHN0_9EURY|nr:PadR family transcriptional regulator [Thermococcus guaymasensis]AJC70768.1 PadR family transcriptional regulator [Thermococcus guaymasensis DSM 11113]MCD6524776.1 PadR family transcriptional regulator [Thermococcus sp.]
MIRRVLLGFMGIHVLHHASREGVTGKFMMDELRKHGYNVSPGTIYPLLHRMEEMGLLKSRTEVRNGKRVRVYTTTPKGEKLLEEARSKVEELCKELLGG